MLDSHLLTSFTSRALAERLATRGPASRWTSEPVEAALLYVDISGFTRLGDRLAAAGPQGAERLTEVLDSIFGPIIAEVDRHGGDVFGFAGDSITAVWLAEPGALADATAMAAHCGFALRHAIPRLETMSRHGLDLKLAVTCGDGRLLEVGGLNGRWAFLLGGEPTAQIPATIGAAVDREVVLSGPAFDLLQSRARVERRNTVGLLRGIDVLPAVPARAPAARPDPGEHAARYLPEAVIHRLESHGWLAELRLVSAVFVNLIGLDPRSDEDVEALQRAVVAFQEVLGRFEGSLDKVANDDKGATMIGIFGLPPRAHEDDAVRATGAATAIARELLGTRQEIGIGVATGRAFCGAYGSEIFRQYTANGSVMNRAARLMQASRNEVLVDGDTRSAAEDRVKFATRPDVVTKEGTEVAVWSPLWETTAAEALRLRLDAHDTPTVGRERELARLERLITDLTESRESIAVTMVGEPGIGKSHLLKEAVSMAAVAGVRPLLGAGDPVLRSTPYNGWRMVVRELLGLSAASSRSERRAATEAFLAMNEGMEDLTPALDPLLELGIDETPATAAMTGAARREVVTAVVTSLLEQAVASRPVMLVFDDAQWLDPASMGLLREVVRQVGPLMTVLATREDDPSVFQPLEGARVNASLKLGGLRREEVERLAREVLGGADLNDQVAAALADKAGGNPLFTRELALAIKETREDAVGASDGWPAEVTLPHSVHALVASRLDRLGRSVELTLKTASVLGQSFSPALIESALGADAPPGGIGPDLDQLIEADLLVNREDGSLAFRHVLIQEIVYEMIPETRRRSTHAMVVEALVAEGSRQHALVAYHAERAGDVEAAVDHLDRAGAEALARGANREAVDLLSRALDLAPATHDEATRRAFWRTQIGMACGDLGELDSALSHHRRALADLGLDVPRRGVGVAMRLFWEMAVQVLHYLWRRRPKSLRVEERGAERDALAARICSLIGEIHYFTVDSLRFVMFNLLSINLAERAGRPAAGGLAYSSLSYLARVLRLRRVAEVYNRRAHDAEELKAEVEDGEGEWRRSLTLPPHSVAAANARGSYQLCFAQWTEALESFAEAEEKCLQRRDHYTLEIVRTLRGQTLMMGRDLPAAAAEYRMVQESAVQRRNAEHTAWALALGIPLLLEIGDDGAAQTWAEAADEALASADRATMPILYAARAQALHHAGSQEQAVADAMRALGGIPVSPIFPQLVGYTSALDVIQDLWDTELVTPQIRRAANRAVRKLGLFAMVLPFARPRAALFRGRALQIRGRYGAANRTLLRGVREAQEGGQRWDEARLWEEIGRSGEPAREEAMVKALDRYRMVGAQAGAARVTAGPGGSAVA